MFRSHGHIDSCLLAFGLARLDATLSILDLSTLRVLLLSRSFMCSGSTISVPDLLQLDSMFPFRSCPRLDLSMPIFGLAHSVSLLLMLDLVPPESIMSVRLFAHLGAFSAALDFLHLGLSFLMRSPTHLSVVSSALDHVHLDTP